MKIHCVLYREDEQDECLRLVARVRARIAKIMHRNGPRRYKDWLALRKVLGIIDH